MQLLFTMHAISRGLVHAYHISIANALTIWYVVLHWFLLLCHAEMIFGGQNEFLWNWEKIKSNHMNNNLVWIHCFVTWEENIFLYNRVNLVVLKSEYSGRTWPAPLIDCIGLTHWGQDKMGDILQTIFNIQFRQWKYLYFDSIFIAIRSQWSC